MLESSKSIRAEQSAEFASAWLDHRLESAKMHSAVLYPIIIEGIQPAAGSVVADYGCGSGDLTLEILEVLNPSKLIAMDVNQYLLDYGRLSCKDRVEVICQDVAEVSPITSNSVDGLVCSNVVMHLSDRDCSNLFAEITRVLSFSGRAVLVFTHPLWAELKYKQETDSGSSFEAKRNWQGCEFVQRYRSVSDYRTLLAKAGLRVEFEATVGIPDLPELAPRYREHRDHPIFCVLKVCRADGEG